ncbi:ABC transporter substrate-binding protein [Gracilibacillus alcaliphilus]|uniref:ABC transporter substrate-binding protein n=1 Tax=Gracilibacillus alcaliphilus TaxID=1401441 RepID=UPI001958803D|nr:sugar ABC transporter substrate-binding protein [Gracilibacillus alcaliphilus]MBM7677633.1 multiple sugar transport system substrate-binding protein [Gracilibacillus alcaliphilus]
MLKKGRKELLFILLFLVSAFLFACSQGEEGTQTSSGSDNENRSNDEPIEIRVATWQTEDSSTKLFNIAKENFEAEHDNVTITIEAAPYENYMTKLQTELAAGNTPDIIQVGEQNFQRYIEKDIIQDLTPLAEGTFDFNSEIIPNVQELMQIDGKNPVMSVGAATIGIYYNKKLFDEAGVPYPEDDWTWEEFVEIAKQLTIKDGEKYIQYGANLNLGKDWVEPFVVSNGGSYLSEDGSTSVDHLNSEATVEAFQKISDLYNVHQVAPNPAELVALKGIDLFATGQVAMNINGNWAQADLRNNPDIEFGVVGLPSMSDGEQTSLMYTSGFGISTQSDYSDVAWEFLYELTGPNTEAGKLWANANLAVTNELLETSAQAEDEYLSVFVDQLDNAVNSAYYINSYWGATGDKLLDPVIQEILLDDSIDMKQRLTDLTAQIDRELQQAAEE